jgi:hypothetical protein
MSTNAEVPVRQRLSEYRKEKYETNPEIKEKTKQTALARYHSLTEEQKEARKARQRELYALRKQEALQTLVSGGSMLAVGHVGAGAEPEVAPPVKRRPRKERTPEELDAMEQKKKESYRKSGAKRLANETPEEREARLAKKRESNVKRMANETPEEREARLAKKREYNARAARAKKKAEAENK